MRGIFNVFGNLAGIIGNILKNLPGYAQVLLNVLQTVTHAVENLTGSGVGQAVIRFGLSFHGLFLYVGLLATGLARLMPIIIGWFAKLSYAAARGAEGMGLDAIAAGLFRIGGAAEVAAAGPWGWIAAAAIGIGALAYKIATAKDATENFTQVMQNTLLSKTAGLQGFNQLVTDQAQTFGRIAQAQSHAASVQQGYNQAVANGGPGVKAYGTYLRETNQTTSDLTSRQKQLNDESNLYNYRLSALAQKYGGARQASELLTQAGVKMCQMLDKA